MSMASDLAFSFANIYALKMFGWPGNLASMCTCNGLWKTHDPKIFPFPSLHGVSKEPYV